MLSEVVLPEEQTPELYDNPVAMEPLLPERSQGLEELAFELVAGSSQLGSAIHPITRASVMEVVRSMNSYYSNLIEGHNTHPVDIEKALKKDFSHDPAKRALQIESVAHVEVQRLIERKLVEEPDVQICSPDFIRWIHSEFYSRLPENFRIVKLKGGEEAKVVPGEFRRHQVQVYRHFGPQWTSVPRFMSRFAEGYETSQMGPLQRIIAAAASHHRLTWIHPFLDGNGRVSRLFTHAFLMKAKIDGHGLWMVSRGFARNQEGYREALAAADARRQSDFDGRGNLSAKTLEQFCKFFLDTAIDQVGFMTRLFDLDSMHERIVHFAAHWCRETRKKFLISLADRMGHFFSDLFSRGELRRGEATAILGIAERTTHDLLKHLVSEGLITSAGPRAPLRLGFPARVTPYYFPKLYPESVTAMQRL